jgi:hypothetical protein
MVEGDTEKVFFRYLREFLEIRLKDAMPKLVANKYDGRLPTKETLKRRVELLLSDSKQPADAVIALTDVYTGTQEFENAANAKVKMSQWVGPNPRFHPHVAQYDFEAWLLPYWEDICELAGSNKSVPSKQPETVNHQRPPSHRIQEVFRTGSRKKSYVKTRDANRILLDKDLSVAANACPELKSFLNTILTLCGSKPLV